MTPHRCHHCATRTPLSKWFHSKTSFLHRGRRQIRADLSFGSLTFVLRCTGTCWTAGRQIDLIMHDVPVERLKRVSDWLFITSENSQFGTTASFLWDCQNGLLVLDLEELCTSTFCEGAVASWLVRSSPDRAVRVRALAGDTVLCSWATHLTVTVPLSTQVYKWVPANLMLD